MPRVSASCWTSCATPPGHWPLLAKGFEQQLERHQRRGPGQLQEGHGGNATFENGPESTIAPMAMPTHHPGVKRESVPETLKCEKSSLCQPITQAQPGIQGNESIRSLAPAREGVRAIVGAAPAARTWPASRWARRKRDLREMGGVPMKKPQMPPGDYDVAGFDDRTRF